MDYLIKYTHILQLFKIPKSKDISGIHFPLSQNMTLSTPTNQSGDGVMCDARETCKHTSEISFKRDGSLPINSEVCAMSQFFFFGGGDYFEMIKSEVQKTLSNLPFPSPFPTSEASGEN